MKTQEVDSDLTNLSFDSAKELADRKAREVIPDPVCLSWYDRDNDREAPAHVSECRDDCDIPGWEEYAASRGGNLKVVVANGAYVFCYRPLGEFA